MIGVLSHVRNGGGCPDVPGLSFYWRFFEFLLHTQMTLSQAKRRRSQDDK